MKKSIMKQWVALLRSGEFKQTTGELENKQGNCCLGILCNLALVNGICDYSISDFNENISFNTARGTLPDCIKKWAGINSTLGYIYSLKKSLSDFNDEDKLNFNQIADIIEKHYKKEFLC